MPRRLGILFLGAAALAAAIYPFAAHALPSAAEAPSAADPSAAPKKTYVGAPSCAAAGCHNGNDLAHAAGSEYSIWSSRDPHARAFAVLGKEPSQKIMTAYRGGGDAQADATCLACHSLTAEPGVPAPPRELLADGVSCEACHGPAGAWRDDHYTRPWRSLSAAETDRLGFIPTRDLARRIELCVGCHVGREGAAVGHDLIAAGHPRLAFEYTAYHDLLPRHWEQERLPRVAGRQGEPEYGGDFLARAWEIGQVTAARQAEAVAESRKAPVSDFADLDCYACHHDLRQPSWRQARPAGGNHGRSDWYTFLPRLLADGGLDPTVKPSKDRKQWAADLQDAAVQAGLDHEKAVKPEAVRALLRRLTQPAAEKDGPANWDQAAQTYLAVAALSRSPGMSQVPPEAIRNLRKTLRFPPPQGEVRIGSPRDFDPAEFRKALKTVLDGLGV